MALVTDSTSSLAPAQATRAGVAVVPLQVVIDGRSRPETEVAAAEVAAALRAGHSVTTSRPTPEVLASTYADLARRGARAVVSVHLSAKISGTCAAAEQAAAAAPIPVTVVDCGTWRCRRVRLLPPRRLRVRPPSMRSSGSLATGGVQHDILLWRTLEFLLPPCVRISPRKAKVVPTALSVKRWTVADGEIRPLEGVRTESRAWPSGGLCLSTWRSLRSERAVRCSHTHLYNLPLPLGFSYAAVPGPGGESPSRVERGERVHVVRACSRRPLAPF